VHKGLNNCTRVFLRQDAICQALESPYSGPYQVLSRREKTLQIGKPLTVSADKVKPAYIFNEIDTVCNPAMFCHNIAACSYPNYAFRSQLTLPRTLQHLNNYLPGCDVGTSHMSDNRRMFVTLKQLVDFLSMVTHKDNVTGVITTIEKTTIFVLSDSTL
jgi:hypothetical protein